MDITEVKDHLINNSDIIEDILNEIKCAKIKNYAKEYRAGYDEYGNPTEIVIKKDNLRMIYRSKEREIKGDIITLVCLKMDISFYEAIKFICKIAKLDYSYSVNTQKKQAFGGYFKQFKKDYSGSVNLKTYPEEIMNDFLDIPNRRFLEDNISLITQKVFDIRYDVETSRIVVAWRNSNGEIIGIMGRYNGDDYNERNISKWFPIIAFPKSYALYGFSQNYSNLIDNTIVVGESEKMVMQLHSMGIFNGVAVGCHSITDYQNKLMKSCFPKNIIIAFDEGIEEDYLREQCDLLKKQTAFNSCRVGYIYDKDSIILPKKSLCSPTDLGKENFEGLLNNCLHWIN